MGDFEDLHAHALAFAHHRKVSKVGDLTPELLILCNRLPAAVLHHRGIGELLGAAGTAARVYGADALALVFEGVLPLVPVNALTGAEWESGEAAEVWRDHDGVAQGWVSECQLVSMVTREMRAAVTARPFVLGGSGVPWSGMQKIGSVGVEQALVRALAPACHRRTEDPRPG